MARASILTLDPRRGGVPALARIVYGLLVAAGHTPALVYRATEDVPTGSTGRALRFFLATPPVRRLVNEGMQSIAITAYPVPPRYQYHLPRLARAAVIAPIAAIVAGSSHVGLPRALARRPYLLWVATVYADELHGRVQAGDRWADGVLGSRDWPILEAQERLVYERATVILAASPHTRERIAARWPTVSHKLRTVVYPVDTDRYRPAGGPADPPYLLLTARIRDPRKNVELLLRAFGRVRSEHARLRLVIAGDEPTPDTRQVAARLGLGESVTFPGYVPADDLVALYQRATLFVFPSLQEGLGISAEEAMACGLPVVSTRSGGPEGLVQDRVTGLLVPNNDEAALAQAIADLLRSPERRRAMGSAGRERAVQLFARTRVEAALRTAFKDTYGDAF